MKARGKPAMKVELDSDMIERIGVKWLQECRNSVIADLERAEKGTLGIGCYSSNPEIDIALLKEVLAAYNLIFELDFGERYEA